MSLSMAKFIDLETRVKFTAWFTKEYKEHPREEVLEDMKTFFETLATPLRYSCGDYSYMLDPDDPTKGLASDGGILDDMKSVMFLAEWVGDLFWDALYQEDSDQFRVGYIDQEQHEGNLLRGD